MNEAKLKITFDPDEKWEHWVIEGEEETNLPGDSRQISGQPAETTSKTDATDTPTPPK